MGGKGFIGWFSSICLLRQRRKRYRDRHPPSREESRAQTPTRWDWLFFFLVLFTCANLCEPLGNSVSMFLSWTYDREANTNYCFDHTNSLIAYLPVLSRGQISFFHYAEGICERYDPGIFLLLLRIRSIREQAGVSLICELPWYKLIKSGEIQSRSGNSARVRCGRSVRNRSGGLVALLLRIQPQLAVPAFFLLA